MAAALAVLLPLLLLLVYGWVLLCQRNKENEVGGGEGMN